MQEQLPGLGYITRYVYRLSLVLVDKEGCCFSGGCGYCGSTTNKNYDRRYVGVKGGGLWHLVLKEIGEQTGGSRTINTADQQRYQQGKDKLGFTSKWEVPADQGGENTN